MIASLAGLASVVALGILPTSANADESPEAPPTTIASTPELAQKPKVVVPEPTPDTTAPGTFTPDTSMPDVAIEEDVVLEDDIVVDSDWDSIADDEDACPTEAGPTSNDGCPPEGMEVTFQSIANNKFVAAEREYADPNFGALRARSDAASDWERFILVGNCRAAEGCAIWSRGTGKYVAAEMGFTDNRYAMLRARSDEASTWERFELVGDCTSAIGCSIRSKENGLMVAAELNDEGNLEAVLRARTAVASTWESFIVRPYCGNGCTIKASVNGKFAAVETTYKGATANAVRATAKADTAVKFELIGDCFSGGTCAFRSIATGKNLATGGVVKGSSRGLLRVASTKVTLSETFRLEGDCAVGCTIKSLSNNLYVSATSGKGRMSAQLVANTRRPTTKNEFVITAS
jgi:hypothetical protein